MEAQVWTRTWMVCVVYCLVSIRFHSVVRTPAQRSNLSSDETLFRSPIGWPAQAHAGTRFRPSPPELHPPVLIYPVHGVHGAMEC